MPFDLEDIDPVVNAARMEIGLANLQALYIAGRWNQARQMCIDLFMRSLISDHFDGPQGLSSLMLQIVDAAEVLSWTDGDGVEEQLTLIDGALELLWR